MWNLRWQVAGFCSRHPSATVQVLDERFLSGSGLRGANFKRACIETDWEDQVQQFAKFSLVALFSIYEGWLEDVFCLAFKGKRSGEAAAVSL